MSKIGRKPIDISGLQVSVTDNKVQYKGPKTSGVYDIPQELKVQIEGSKLLITPASSEDKQDRQVKAQWGLHHALLANKLKGARAILRDSAKDVIEWCDKTGSGESLYCIDRLRAAIVTTEHGA